jgi:hypothetical protein
MPAPLSVGHLRTPEFKVNQNAFYIIEIEVGKTIPFETLNCLLGVESTYQERCKGTPSVVHATWTLTSSGAVVARGSAEEFKGGGWTNDTISREIGSFNSEKGRRYVLEVDILSDGTRLEAGHPRLKVGVHPQHYEDNMVMSLFVTLFTAICVLIGVVLLLVGLVRRRSNPAPVAPVPP